jgi:hypothetical protein
MNYAAFRRSVLNRVITSKSPSLMKTSFCRPTATITPLRACVGGLSLFSGYAPSALVTNVNPIDFVLDMLMSGNFDDGRCVLLSFHLSNHKTVDNEETP